MHIMIDIETLGTGPRAPVIQIGARMFYIPSGPGNEPLGLDFCVNIAAQDVILRGAILEEGTVSWWRGQDPGVIASLTMPAPTSAVRALTDLRAFIGQFQEIEGVWANGDSFDIGLLNTLHDQCEMDVPWSYNKPRDCRTLYWAARELASWERPQRKTTHNAVQDATDQALDVIDAWSWLANRHARLGEEPIEIDMSKVGVLELPAAPRAFGPVGTGHR